jgi:2-amino-4-hydroxy-6-hydroxymethyldihydropteridine diphosphokinase
LNEAGRGRSVVYIGVGSNLGDRRKNLAAALTALRRSSAVKLLKVSSIVNTVPVDNVNQPDFLNQVVSIETTLSPRELLAGLQDIENRLGRERLVWKGPRTIDLDILLYGTLVLNESDLTIPHPELMNRSFFIYQILEIDPDATEPASCLSFSSFVNGREI